MASPTQSQDGGLFEWCYYMDDVCGVKTITAQVSTLLSVIEQLIEVRKNRAMTQRQLTDRRGRLQSYAGKVEVCERKMDSL